MLQSAEDYVPYTRQLYKYKSFPEGASGSDKAQIIAEADKFEMIDGVLNRKVKQEITALYIDCQFLGDLMQRMRSQYGRLSYSTLVNVLESRA